MLDDLYQADTDAAIADMVARPVIKPQATKFNGWKAITAVPRGAVAGAIETGAMVPDLAEAAGNAFTSVATGLLPDPRAPGGAEFKAREQQRAQGASSAEGDYLRQQTKQFMPDPHSAHLAEQTVFGLSRFATKAVGSTVVAGPAGGAAALGVNEGLTTADDLKAQGVDLETRTKIGAVAGAVSAVGVALPMAGKTVSTTVGLWAAGGPASFIGQQAATKQILQSAGYDKLSDQIDPLDPVGLAVSSVVPAGFAAWGLRRQAAVKALKTEADVKAAAALTPDEQARSDAFETSDANLDLLRKDITQAKTPAAKAALQENLDSLLKLRAQREASGAPTLEQVDAARVEMLTQHMEGTRLTSADDVAGVRAHDEAMTRAMDQIAKGERIRVDDVAPVPRMPTTDTPEFKAWFGDSRVVDDGGKPLVVYHGTARNFDSFDIGQAGSAIDAGKLGEGFYFTQASRWADSYATNAAQGGGDAQVMPVFISIKNPLVLDGAGDVWTKLRAASERWGIKESPVLDEVNTPNPAWAKEFSAAAQREGFDGVVLPSKVNQTEYVAFKPEQIKSAIGNSGKFDPNSPSLTDSRFATWADQINAAIADIRAAAAKETTNVQDAPKAAGQPAEAPTQAQPQTAVARGAGPAGAGEQGPGVSGSGGAAAEAGLVAQRLTDIQQQFPDLTVQMDGMDAPVKLADFLEQVKREAIEGTDMDLGGNDAPLMQVAASCFLLNG